MWERMAGYRSEEGSEAYRRKHGATLLRRWASRREVALARRLLARLGPLDSVLDCACGAGRMLPGLAGIAARVVGIDQSDAMLRLARAATERARVLRADAYRLPLPDQAVDAVVALRLLYHFPAAADRVRLLTELARVARRGVVFTFADAGTWRARRSHSRRIRLDEDTLCRELHEAGLALDPPTLRVASPFSVLALALARPR